jgi:hypothetical protein
VAGLFHHLGAAHLGVTEHPPASPRPDVVRNHADSAGVEEGPRAGTAEEAEAEVSDQHPASVRIGTVPYRVTSNPDEFMRIENETQNSGAYGHTRHREATIYLNPVQTIEVERMTLLHEVMHALCETAMGSPSWLDLGENASEREERIIRMYEAPLMDVFANNPDLVAYLFG